MNRSEVLKKVIFEKPYRHYFALVFFFYLLLNIYVNKIHVTLPTLVNSTIFIPFTFFLLVVAFLVAINVNLVIYRFKELKKMSKSSGGLGVLGVLGGLLGGACPGCFVGLFPAVVGLFGVTASLGSLPLYGIEIQMISVIILLVSFYFLTKNDICEIPAKN